MFAALSLPMLNMITTIGVILGIVFLLLAVAAGVMLGFTFEQPSYYDDEERRATKKAQQKARRRPCIILLALSILIAVSAAAMAAWSGTEYGIRHDTNVPNRVNRSEIKVDSNAPTGVIVDGR